MLYVIAVILVLILIVVYQIREEVRTIRAREVKPLNKAYWDNSR